MTKIKLCGLSRHADIAAANAYRPEYIGFVFAKKSSRYVSPETAAALKKELEPAIQAVGVFVDEAPETVAHLLEEGVIDIAQLHGREDAAYIARLRTLTGKPLIQAVQVKTAEDVRRAEESPADYVLLDSGAGSGEVFDWSILQGAQRDYFLAGGLAPENAGAAVTALHPFALDVSSGIETDGHKDPEKMKEFVRSVRAAGKED